MNKVSRIFHQLKLVRKAFPQKGIISVFLTLFDIKVWQKKRKMLWNEFFGTIFAERKKKNVLIMF